MRITVDSRIEKGLKAEYVEESSDVLTETIKHWIRSEEIGCLLKYYKVHEEILYPMG